MLKTHQEFFLFLGENYLREHSDISDESATMCVLTRSMDAATQMLDHDETITQFGVEDLVRDLKTCDNSHTSTTTTTG